MGGLGGIRERVTARPALRARLAEIAETEGRDLGEVQADAAAALDEMAATHVDPLVAGWSRAYRFFLRGYEEIECDAAEIARVRELGRDHTLLYLPSHRSNLDGPTLWLTRRQYGLPPVHLFGGLNMAFWPVGDLMRRLGTVYIRRKIGDDAVYRAVLRAYIGDLVEQRHDLEWYLEGTRSRTGKMNPPKLGLLSYVEEAMVESGNRDVVALPVSITYDHLPEVTNLVVESSGATKRAEDLGWAFRALRELSAPSGRIRVSFGEPLFLDDALAGNDADEDERSRARYKAAFEVCARINKVTPATPAAILALTMLGSSDAALTLEAVHVAATERLSGMQSRGLPITEVEPLQTPSGVEEVLDTLARRGIVSVFSGGPETVYRIAPDDRLEGAYYRNTIAHHLIVPSIAESALLSASTAKEDRITHLHHVALQLRDVLKFDFFFSDRTEFLEEIHAELDFRDPTWREVLEERPKEVRALLRGAGPLWAHLVLRPFLEAYAIAAEHLVHLGDSPVVDRRAEGSRILDLGRQRLLQRRIIRPEAVSADLFSTALELASHRGLLEGDRVDVTGRQALLDELAALVTVTDEVETQSRVRLSLRQVPVSADVVTA